MIELIKNKFIAVTAVSLAVFGLGVYVFLYRPSVQELERTRQVYNEIDLSLGVMNKKILNLENDLINSSIPAEDISLAIDELTRDGRLKGVNFVSIIPMKLEEGKNSRKMVPLSIEIKSGYEQLGEFVYLFYKFNRSVVTVKSIQINPDKNNPEIIITKLNLNMYLKDAGYER